MHSLNTKPITSPALHLPEHSAARMTRDPEFYYDRVMPAWRLFMGRNLHLGCFEQPNEDIDTATHNLTLRMARHAHLENGLRLLDVGAGDGQNSCVLAEQFGCRVIGISTGRKGVEEARRLSRRRGLTGKADFLVRDGMDNRLPDHSFDRVWVLQSSHFMLDKRRMFSECVRVLRPGGRIAIADIMLRSPLPIEDVVRDRKEFLLLHRVFGRAKIEHMSVYQTLAQETGVRVDVIEDLTAHTLPTFDRWRHNAAAHKRQIVSFIGEGLWREFLDAADVLETFWREGRYGYGIVAGTRL